MKQRGRKSAAELSVIALDSQSAPPSPPATLSEPERELFVGIVAGCDAGHFRQTDLPLLSRYCEAAILAEQAALELRNGAVVDGKPSPWIVIQEKCVRAMVSLSMRLRLSPQSRLDPKTLGRQQPYSGRKPWDPPNDRHRPAPDPIPRAYGALLPARRLLPAVDDIDTDDDAELAEVKTVLAEMAKTKAQMDALLRKQEKAARRRLFNSNLLYPWLRSRWR